MLVPSSRNWHEKYCYWFLHFKTHLYMRMDLWKPIQITQKLKFILLLNVKPLATLALPRSTKLMAIGGKGCFHRWPFAVPVKTLRCTTGSLGLVNGINKGVSGARLLPTTVLTYPVDWVCFCHWLNTHYCPLCLIERHNPAPATHPLHPLLPAHPL